MEERWRRMNGVVGHIQVSTTGKIVRIYKNGVKRQLHGYVKKGKLLVFKVAIAENKIVEYPVKKVVYDTFVGNRRSNHCIVHSDKNHENCSLDNLYIVTKEKRGKRTGPSHNRAKAVVLVDLEEKKVLGEWTSTREAAKKNFCSYQMVSDSCNRKTKKPSLTFRWKSEWERRKD